MRAAPPLSPAPPLRARPLRAPPLRPALLRLAPLLAAVAAACALAGCGKGGAAQNPSLVARSAGLVEHEAVPGAVSVVTKNTTRLGGSDAASDAAAVARAVFPGLTPATRPAAVVLVDERDWPAALASAALASAPLGAPILYSEGASVPAVSAQALQALNPKGAGASLEGAKVISIGGAAPAPAREGAGLLRVPVAGARTPEAAATTAAEIARVLDAARGTTARAVIAVDLAAARALQMPAAGLAAESGAPVVYIDGGTIPAATAKLLAHGLSRRPAIYLLGATDAAAARAALARFGHVSVIEPTAATAHAQSAPERASENAIAVARFGAGSFGWNIHEAGHGLVFANASRPLDAPAAAPLAAHGDYAPLLLLEEGRSVPASLARYLTDIQPAYSETVPPVRAVYNHGWLIGDERAIAVGVQAQLDAMLEVVQRSSASEEATLGPGE